MFIESFLFSSFLFLSAQDNTNIIIANKQHIFFTIKKLSAKNNCINYIIITNKNKESIENILQNIYVIMNFLKMYNLFFIIKNCLTKYINIILC